MGDAHFDGTIDILLSEDLAPVDPNAIYTLIDVSGAFNSTASFNLPDGYRAGVQGNSIVFGSSNAVPEPSSWILLILGAAGICLYRRRRV